MTCAHIPARHISGMFFVQSEFNPSEPRASPQYQAAEHCDRIAHDAQTPFAGGGAV